MDIAFRRQHHFIRAEFGRQAVAQPGEMLGAGGGDDGGAADPAPGHHRLAQAQFGAERVDHPRVGPLGQQVDHRRIPLPRQGRHQVGLGDPVMGQQNVPQPHILTVAQRQRLEQVAGRDRTHLEQDLPQRRAARTRGGAAVRRADARSARCFQKIRECRFWRFALWVRHKSELCCLFHSVPNTETVSGPSITDLRLTGG